MLMAGLDGILNKIDPGEPLDKDIYDLSPEEMKVVPSMPASLDEALIALEEDQQFLLKGDVFTADLIETFIDYNVSMKWTPSGCVLTLTNSHCTTTSSVRLSLSASAASLPYPWQSTPSPRQ
jgi:hypothetical protein